MGTITELKEQVAELKRRVYELERQANNPVNSVMRDTTGLPLSNNFTGYCKHNIPRTICTQCMGTGLSY